MKLVNPPFLFLCFNIFRNFNQKTLVFIKLLHLFIYFQTFATMAQRVNQTAGYLRFLSFHMCAPVTFPEFITRRSRQPSSAYESNYRITHNRTHTRARAHVSKTHVTAHAIIAWCYYDLQRIGRS